ncbi:LPS translocon maturation chaperone LptM [Methylobacterium sp. E-066]|uniref:LPS translocon maturation chaperone LptM n=1 Tax=Methylobacterium sp. E-066 TaxID=2836584 RepID=UPI001FBB9F6F|nr:lipoprotein [Methylobacterium sp. E-066]MCJ2142363.1 lipoprotein [Methylobacterium sp. E-066]
MLSSPALKLLAVSGLVALGVSACGRRGALEPPQTAAPTPTAQAGSDSVNGRRTLPVSVGLGGGAEEPTAEGVRTGDELSVAAVPPGGTGAPIETSRGAKRGYRIPKEPFILDPLL